MQHHKVFIRLWFNIKQKLLIGLATFIRLCQWINISAGERDSGTGDWTLSSLGTEHNWLRNNEAKKVPAGEYFVLGDHRSVSNDGRYFGFVPKDKIDGVVKVMPWTGDEVQRNNVNDEWKEFY